MSKLDPFDLIKKVPVEVKCPKCRYKLGMPDRSFKTYWVKPTEDGDWMASYPCSHCDLVVDLFLSPEGSLLDFARIRTTGNAEVVPRRTVMI